MTHLTNLRSWLLELTLRAQNKIDDLQELFGQMRENDVKIGGVGDHGISIGIYFFDPDGNEIEAFYELPKDQWPEDGNLFAGDFPQKLVDPAAAVA